MKELFSESSSISMMRVMALISLMASIGLAYAGKPGYEVFVLAAFGGKVAQKVAEVK